jgi:acyl carrier protein
MKKLFESNTEPPSHFREDVLRFLSQATGQTCTVKDSCADLGVDSVLFLELVIFVEKRFGIPLPLQLLTSHPLTTIQSLLDALEPLLVSKALPENVEA